MMLMDILGEISEKYPTGLYEDSILRKINNVQNRLFRTICKEIVSTKYDVVEGQNEYEIDFHKENIVHVLVGGVEYPTQGINRQFYYRSTREQLIIYPTPTKDVPEGIEVLHYKEPRQLDMSNDEDEPELDRDYHMLLVYGTCKELAEAALDANMVNVFVSQYNSLEEEYKRYKNADTHCITDVFGEVWL